MKDEIQQADEWLEALYDSFCELSDSQLVFSSVEKLGHFDCLPDVTYGSCLQLAGKEIALQICIASNTEGCHAIGEKMLGDLDDDDLLPDVDYADAIGEILNTITGSVIRKFLADDDRLNLGLPFFVNGHLEVSKNAFIRGLSFIADELPFSFIFVRLDHKGTT